jgi:hypothetical protein
MMPFSRAGCWRKTRIEPSPPRSPPIPGGPRPCRPSSAVHRPRGARQARRLTVSEPVRKERGNSEWNPVPTASTRHSGRGDSR